jgi:hypothetical protein
MNASTLRMRRDQIFDRSENTIEVYGSDRRGREFYQNWILRSGGSEGNPYFTYVSSMSPSDEMGIPPDLAIESPVAPVVLQAGRPNAKVHVKALASAAGGVASIEVNGKAVGAGGHEMEAVDQDFVVQRSDKTLAIAVTDKKGNKRAVNIPVIDPRPAAPPPKIAGTPWALVIGVSRFTAKAGAPPALPMAAFDAKEMADALKARGFKEANIRLLLDEQATAEQVRTALRDFANRAQPQDLFLLYWSTQGLHDPTSPDRVYLAASDSQVAHLAETAIETTELQQLLERSVRSRHTLLFFDAEHPLGSEWAFQGAPIVNTHLLNLFDDQLGRSVLVAGASAGVPSGRSAFSTAVTEGLAGKADIDQNHVVTAREICDYVIEQVRTSTGGTQTPRALLSKHEEEAPVLSLR